MITYDWAEERDIEGINAAIFIGFGISLLVGIIGFFAEGLTGLFNPEYGALQDIIGVFK